MQITNYLIPKALNCPPMRIAFISDLHNKPHDKVIAACIDNPPDLIAISGDLMECLDESFINNPHEWDKLCRENKEGFTFLQKAAEIAPTFYSLGNHERSVTEATRSAIAKTGAVLLDNAAVQFRGIHIGGLSSGRVHGYLKETPSPNLEWLAEFAALDGFKLLLNHHPEYYPAYIKKTNIELILSGHAHGGQWRFFGQGVFSPGQGLFPKYTSGMHDNRLIISRGLANTAKIPRINNPTELVFIEIK